MSSGGVAAQTVEDHSHVIAVLVRHGVRDIAPLQDHAAVGLDQISADIPALDGIVRRAFESAPRGVQKAAPAGKAHRAGREESAAVLGERRLARENLTSGGTASGWREGSPCTSW